MENQNTFLDMIVIPVPNILRAFSFNRTRFNDFFNNFDVIFNKPNQIIVKTMALLIN